MFLVLVLMLPIVILQAVSCEAVTSDLVVETTVGAVRGVRATNGDYTMYLGIPYAQVNRSNPFGMSQPQHKFENVFEANDDSKGCPEKSEASNLIEGTLDCLNLNVHVPDSVQNKKPLPVLVLIYGGNFKTGSSQPWKPTYLMKHDIILVTFNYRSGPYGFMCLGTPEVPGNQGLKDQAMALRWIKDNIRAFGGDDDNITLYGDSSGSGLLHHHLLFNKDTNFKTNILMSGVALAPWGTRNKDESVPLILAGRLGFITNSTTEALAFLAKQHELSVTQASEDAEIVYRPCVEQSFDGVEDFITEHPVNVIPNVQNVTILMGYTEDENMYMIDTDLKNATTKYGLDEVLRTALNSNFDTDKNDELFSVETSIMHSFYSGDETDKKKIKRAAVNATSDYFMCYPIERATRLFVENGAKIYRYLFTYVGKRNFKKKIGNITVGGATHADEVSYIFERPILFPGDPTPADQHMINVLTTLIYNFVSCSDPTPSPTELLPVKWLPVTNDTLHYLRIDSTLSMGTRPFNRRMAFWDLLFMTNRKYIKDVDKLHQVCNNMIMGVNGDQGDSLQFSQFITKNISLYKIRNRYSLDTASVVHFIRKNMADSHRSGAPMALDLLIGGYDGRGPQLYYMDYLASCVKVPFAAHGLGGLFIIAVLENYYRSDMTQDQAYELIKVCVQEIQRRLFVNLPSFAVKVITKDGISTLDSITLHS